MYLKQSFKCAKMSPVFLALLGLVPPLTAYGQGEIVPLRPEAMQIQPLAVVVRIDDPNSPVKQVTFSSPRGLDTENTGRQNVMPGIVEIATRINSILTDAGFAAADCIDIHTGECTTIRINCPVITLGEPTVDVEPGVQ